jgi:tripartite ATP-independent transporter DctM subunit
MARVAIPEMLTSGYSPRLAAGTLAAGGTLGIMIPPSIALLLYALITEQSVGAMFMAGLIPGVLAFLLYCVTVVILVRRNPGQAETTAADHLSIAQAIAKGVPVLVLFLTVMGGLYGGLFTPTEAAGAGAFLAFVFAVYRGMRFSGFISAVTATIRTSATIFLIIIGAELFGYLLSVSQITFELVNFIRDLNLQPWQVLVIILGFFIVFGLFMDSLAIILLTVPIFYPLIVEMGIDPIWFGILAVVAVEIGLITPPVGMNLFIIRSVAPGISLRDVMYGTVPFVLADIVRLIILLLFPALILILPQWMGLH